jgi:hypothetical protein
VILGNSDNNGSASQLAVAPNNSYSGVGTTNPPIAAVQNGISAWTEQAEMALESTNIYGVSSTVGGTNTQFLCQGWEDNL